jgi:hypothetical protein
VISSPIAPHSVSGRGRLGRSPVSVAARAQASGPSTGRRTSRRLGQSDRCPSLQDRRRAAMRPRGISSDELIKTDRRSLRGYFALLDSRGRSQRQMPLSHGWRVTRRRVAPISGTSCGKGSDDNGYSCSTTNSTKDTTTYQALTLASEELYLLTHFGDRQHYVCAKTSAVAFRHAAVHELCQRLATFDFAWAIPFKY